MATTGCRGSIVGGGGGVNCRTYMGGQLSGGVNCQGGQLSRYLLSALIELLFISGPVSFSKFVVHQGRSKGSP